MKLHIIVLFAVFMLTSCASKKDIIYLQDADKEAVNIINYQNATIQPNDILKITVETLTPEASLPYNRSSGNGMQAQSIQLMQLDGYLVSLNNTIDFPVLGEISTMNLSTSTLGKLIKDKLETGGHLTNPSVVVRLINAKVLVLGEVNKPGTYSFTEQNITLLQALGYAGDLTINGKRNDILMTREVDGVRKVTHIDLTSAAFMNSEFYFIKPNDLIVVNPNNPKVKESGFIANIGTVLTIASVALSITILLTR